MAKFDGVKGQELLDVERTKDELTLILKDNRYVFVKVRNGQIVVEPAVFDGVKGQELEDVEESSGEVKIKFKGDLLLSVKTPNGQLVVDSVPE